MKNQFVTAVKTGSLLVVPVVVPALLLGLVFHTSSAHAQEPVIESSANTTEIEVSVNNQEPNNDSSETADSNKSDDVNIVAEDNEEIDTSNSDKPLTNSGNESVIDNSEDNNDDKNLVDSEQEEVGNTEKDSKDSEQPDVTKEDHSIEYKENAKESGSSGSILKPQDNKKDDDKNVKRTLEPVNLSIQNDDNQDESEQCEADFQANLTASAFNAGEGEVTVTNTSDDCTYDVGVASYKAFSYQNPNTSDNDNNLEIDNQELFDHALDTLGPGEHVNFDIDVPHCAFQIDTFHGDLIVEFNGDRYGDRKLDGKHDQLLEDNLCEHDQDGDDGDNGGGDNGDEDDEQGNQNDQDDGTPNVGNPDTLGDNAICEFSPENHDYVIVFDNDGNDDNSNRLFSKLNRNNDTDETAVSIPAGTYSVSLHSEESHGPDSRADRTKQTQLQEQYFVDFLNSNGQSIAQSSSTPDLVDETATAAFADEVDSELVLSTEVASIIGKHSVVFPSDVSEDDSSHNSVNAVCAALDKVEDESQQCLNPDPENDLRLVEFDADAGTAKIVNDSDVCDYEVGIASYKGFQTQANNPNQLDIPSQELFDHELATVLADDMVNLDIDVPQCAYQIDVFYGDLIEQFADNDGDDNYYGDRKLDEDIQGWAHVNVDNLCESNQDDDGDEEEEDYSMTICKALVDQDGNLITGSDLDANFTLNASQKLSEGENEEVRSPWFNLGTPLNYNTDVFTDFGGLDAVCHTFDEDDDVFLRNKNSQYPMYYYEPEVVTGVNSTVYYNDDLADVEDLPIAYNEADFEPYGSAGYKFDGSFNLDFAHNRVMVVVNMVNITEDDDGDNGGGDNGDEDESEENNDGGVGGGGGILNPADEDDSLPTIEGEVAGVETLDKEADLVPLLIKLVEYRTGQTAGQVAVTPQGSVDAGAGGASPTNTNSNSVIVTIPLFREE